jgi:GntR family transcriptional repressor for pyruvate dehydrogenase complex
MSLADGLGPHIRRTVIADELIVRFKHLISTGVFAPGGKLPPEAELSEALAVSRPTLRQALRALQILGVIRSRQGSGSYVADSAADILREPLEFALALKGVGKADLFETRWTLEVKLASLAAERRTDDDLDKLRRTLARMQAAMGVPQEWCLHEVHFHDCIVKAARNAVMATIMEMLSRMLIESRKETVRLLDDYPASYRSHEAVFLEIEAQHPEGAALAMHEHFVIMEARAHKCQLVRVGDDGSA